MQNCTVIYKGLICTHAPTRLAQNSPMARDFTDTATAAADGTWVAVSDGGQGEGPHVSTTVCWVQTPGMSEVSATVCDRSVWKTYELTKTLPRFHTGRCEVGIHC